MWIGSSRGPLKGRELIKPDIVAPGVDIIGPYINNNYAKATGTGVSSSLACGVMALIIEYINNQGTYASRAIVYTCFKDIFNAWSNKKYNIFIS